MLCIICAIHSSKLIIWVCDFIYWKVISMVCIQIITNSSCHLLFGQSKTTKQGTLTNAWAIPCALCAHKITKGTILELWLTRYVCLSFFLLVYAIFFRLLIEKKQHLMKSHKWKQKVIHYSQNLKTRCYSEFVYSTCVLSNNELMKFHT